LKDFRASWNNAKVLIIGDVMLDKWTYHLKTRISPEAPIPVVKEEYFQSELGGAGNALRHLNFLSNQNHELLTVIGDDQAGLDLREVAKRSRSKIHWVQDYSRKTTVKERFFLNDDLIFRKDTEAVENVSVLVEAEIIDILKSIANKFDVILLSDYAKGVLSQNLIQQIREISRSLNIPTVVDPGLGRVQFYKGCTFIKPNLIEWTEYIESSGGEAEGLKLMFEQGTQSVLITQSSQGLRYITPIVDSTKVPRDAIEVVDVTGAGDSLAAALSLLIGEGSSIIDCLEILNEIGANTVRQSKTQLPGEI